jgi:sulfofructose kinase
MNILGIGEITLDKSYLLSNFPQEDSKVEPLASFQSMGGPVPAALVLLANLGATCTLVASIGRDLPGKSLARELQKKNIDLHAHLKSVTKVNTYLVNQTTGSRTGIKGDIKHQPINEISRSQIKAADLIIFDRHEPAAFASAMAAKKKSTLVLLDPSTDTSPSVLEMLAQTTVPILPIESVKKINPQGKFAANLQLLLTILTKPFVVTASNLGSFLFDGKHLKFAPAVKVPVVDVLGAGDVYRGAFAYGLLQNWDTFTCLKYANLVAGLQCAKVGNGTAIPTRVEIAEAGQTQNFQPVSKIDLDQMYKSIIT